MVGSVFERTIRSFFDSLNYITLVRASLRWIADTAPSGKTVLVKFFSLSLFFETRKGFRGRAGFSATAKRDADFIVSIPRRKKISFPDVVVIFSSALLEVYEKIDLKIEVQPIRYGLVLEERAELLRIARRALEWFLRRGSTPRIKEIPTPFSQRFLLQADVDVTIWVDGVFRGSRIVEGMSLVRGVMEAARRASEDPRFKPLTLEELQRTRIEIVIFSPLRVPLMRGDLNDDRIDSAKGYVYKKGAKVGWYLPPVHNTSRFSGLKDFLTSLVEKKAQDAMHSSAYRHVHTFDTIDFVESSDRSVLDLVGPVPETIPNDVSWYERAAEWLCVIQEKDGSIPAVTNALTGQPRPAIDWLRLALAGQALAEFGDVHNHSISKQAARRAWTYISSLDFLERLSSQEQYLLTLTYVIELGRSLAHRDDVRLLTDRLYEAHVKAGKKWRSVLPMAHIARVLSLSKVSEHQEEGRRIQDILRDQYEKTDDKSFSPVQWAEAVVLFWGTDRKFARRIADRICECEFPGKRNTESKFAYTRGAGKILEVLVLDPVRYKTAIEGLEAWMQTMQYSEGSAFFVPRNVRSGIVGALRHDALNTEVWSDSVAHCLIARARTK